MMTIPPSFRQHKSGFNHGLRRVLVLGASVAVCGTASFTIVDAARAQAGPFPPQREDSRGSEGTANLQRRLAEMGYYNGEISGYYGPQTHEAVTRFQQDMGLEADGIVGPATAQALSEWGGAPESAADPYGAPSNSDPYDDESAQRNTVQLNDEGEQVAELQQRLADLGYYEGDFSGVFDYATEAAVMQFQRNNGLEADGVVGPGTEDTLRRPSEEIQRPIAPSEATSETGDPQASNSVPGDSTDSQGNLLRAGDSGQAVSELQTRLQALGFYQGSVSGTYDSTTEAAVIAFQQSQGLSTDGIAGPQVNSALYNPALTAANPTAANSTGTPSADASLPNLNPTDPGSATAASSPVNPSDATASAPQTAPTLDAQQALQQAEQARLEAEQARLEAEQARLVLNQNFDEGRYSVASLQRHLRNEGLYSGEISGILTTETQEAIVAAQQKHGLSQSDLFGASSTSAPLSF